MASRVWGPPPVRKQSPQLLHEEDRVQNGGGTLGRNMCFYCIDSREKQVPNICEILTCFWLQRELRDDGASWAVSLTREQKTMDEQGLGH